MATAKKGTPSYLDRLVSNKLVEIRARSAGNLGDLPIFEFLTATSPHYEAPDHLTAAVPYLEAIDESPQFFALSAPPRCGKSVLINHFAARQMIRHPGLKVAYGCYNLDLAGFNSLEVKDILSSNNVTLDKTQNSKEEWRISNGSSFKCVAPGSGFTGRGADLIIVDDPYKGRAEAESGRIRDATWSWFTAVAITRRSPNASVIVTHTRWTADDLVGTITSQHGRPYVNLPAINKDGEALWPKYWPVEKLQEIRSIIGEYEWSSLYMGEPRPRGGSVFGDPTLYGAEGETFTDGSLDSRKKYPELPKKFKRVYIGIDCAYTKRTHSDYSVAVVLGVADDGRAYVLDMRRMQCDAPAFAMVLKQLRNDWGSPPIYWSIGGIEKAVVDFFMNSCGVPVKAVNAREDKFVRAQAVAAAWNAGKILVPATDTNWSRTLLSEVLQFTGLDDPHDDIVDALAAAFIPLAGKKVARGTMDKQILSF